MDKILIPCEVGEVSDGYHTFNELYQHRHTLFIALMRAYPEISWRSRLHHDGSKFEGWFIAGMDLNGKQITYHLPDTDEYWQLLNHIGIKELDKAPEWDGHTSGEVVRRLQRWMVQ